MPPPSAQRPLTSKLCCRLRLSQREGELFFLHYDGPYFIITYLQSLEEAMPLVRRYLWRVDVAVFTLHCARRPPIEPESLPRLPDIFSEELRRQVFMHRSYYARPTNVFEDFPDDPSPDNEA